MTTRDEISELINAAFGVATAPTTKAFRRTSDKKIPEWKMIRLLHALEPLVTSIALEDLRARLAAAAKADADMEAFRAQTKLETAERAADLERRRHPFVPREGNGLMDAITCGVEGCGQHQNDSVHRDGHGGYLGATA